MTGQISHQMPGQALPGQPPAPVAGPRHCNLPGAARAAEAAGAATRAWHPARPDPQAGLAAVAQPRADADTADASAHATRDRAGPQVTEIRQQADAAIADARAAASAAETGRD